MKNNIIRLITLHLMFVVLAIKAQVVSQFNNDLIIPIDSIITVSASDFESTCKICNYDSNCLKLKYDNKLIKVEGSLFLDNTPITSLGNLLSVSRNLLLDNTRIGSFSNLKLVGGNLFITNTQLSKLYNEKQIRNILKVIGKISGCENITSKNDSRTETSYNEVIENVQTIVEQDDITVIKDINTDTSYFGGLTNTPPNVNQYEITVSSDDFVSKCVHCSNNLNCVNQKYNNKDIIIEGDLDLGYYRNSINIEDLGNVICIKGSLNLYQSYVKNLGKLERVEGSLSLSGREDSLGNLLYVGGNLHVSSYSYIANNYTKKDIRESINVVGIISGIPEIKSSIPSDLFISLWGPNQTQQVWYCVDDPSNKRNKNYYSNTRVIFTRSFKNNIPDEYIVGISPNGELDFNFNDYYTISFPKASPKTMRLTDKEGNDYEFWITNENSKFHLYGLTAGSQPEFNQILKPISASKNNPYVPQRHKKH